MALGLSISNYENIQFADELLYFWQLLHHIKHKGMQPVKTLLNPVRIRVLAEVAHHYEILERMTDRLRYQLQ